MNLYENSHRKLRLPSAKRVLIKIHTDLIRIDKFVDHDVVAFSLNEFEIMVLLLEDRRFFRHNGIDIYAFIREILRALMLRRHGGASTIDMQFVRTATGYREYSFSRKLYECLLAIVINFRYSKITILRSYLKCAFFGSHLIGADSASFKDFGQYSESLIPQQASLIAAYLVYPRPMTPTNKWAENIRRRSHYAERLYIAHKKRFEKIPTGEPF